MFFIAGLVGCATPPGKLQENDFISRQFVTSQSVQVSLSNFYEGLRFCGPESGGLVFVTHHGVPDCAPVRPNGVAVCDLYIGNSSLLDSGGRSDRVLGRVEFAPIPSGASVMLKVIDYAAGKENILKAWESFVNGKFREVCE